MVSNKIAACEERFGTSLPAVGSRRRICPAFVRFVDGGAPDLAAHGKEDHNFGEGDFFCVCTHFLKLPGIRGVQAFTA